MDKTTETKNKIIDNIKVYKKLLGKSKMTAGNKYQIKMTYKGKNIYFIYNDNIENNSKKIDILYCILMDATAYTNCYNFADFMAEFGYDKEAEAKKVYNGCKRNYNKLTTLFTDAEVEDLEAWFTNY